MYDIKLSDIDTVIFDFDETIVASIESVLLTANYFNDYELKIGDLSKVRKWNLEDVLIGIKDDEVEDIFKTKMFFDLLKPYQSMIDAMEWFKNKGKTIVILSLGTPLNLHLKSKWIDDNLTGLFDYLILAGSQNSLKMDKSVFNYNKRCVLIDDNFDNLNTSPCEYKIMSKLYTQEPTEWSKGWQGLSISSGEELINTFY